MLYIHWGPKLQRMTAVTVTWFTSSHHPTGDEAVRLGRRELMASSPHLLHCRPAGTSILIAHVSYPRIFLRLSH